MGIVDAHYLADSCWRHVINPAVRLARARKARAFFIAACDYANPRRILAGGGYARSVNRESPASPEPGSHSVLLARIQTAVPSTF